ncbi:MAG: hypothetical protein MI976_25215 [Pseudomonadales bacterium]|nr:hypothetical protein [Pseudomonadales bacterium]
MKAVQNSHRTLISLGCSLMLLCSNLSFADSDTSQSNSYLSFNLSAGIGFSSSELQWSIGSDLNGTETPNILSELTYADLEFDEFVSSGKIRINQGMLEGVSISGRYLKGEASDGVNQDSDYSGDNRTDEYSRSHSDAEGSGTTQFEILVGYDFSLSESWTLTPIVGYGFSEQDMLMTNGVQILDTRAVALSLGPFTGRLNSSYTAEWDSLVYGVELRWASNRHEFTAGVNAYLSDYYAEANWNLRDDFAHPVSFAHWSEGSGIRWKAHYRYQFSRYFSAWIEAHAEEYEADPGRDVVYFADGSRGATRLNGVTWESSGYALGIAFNF